jgi:hypothetical protein
MPYPNFVAGETLEHTELNSMVQATAAAQARADAAHLLIPGGTTSGQSGKVLLSSFSGSTDDARLTNALSYAAAQTRRPVIVLDRGVGGGTDITFSQSRTTYSGMRFTGPAENTGWQNTEIAGSNGAYTPGRVTLNVGNAASSWLVGNTTTYSIGVQDICFNGNGNSQFFEHTIAAGTCYCANFRNLQFNSFKHIMGRPAEPMSCTLGTWEGVWNVTGVADQQISLRGSDNWFCPTAFNIGWNNAPANTYLIRISNVSKSWMSGIYATARNTTFATAGCRAFLNEGPASQQGGMFVSNCVIEGQNLNEYTTGALIVILGGGVTFHHNALNFGMGQPALSGDTADIMISGGHVRLDSFDINKAATRSENTAVIRATGGRVSIKEFEGQGSWNNAILPLALNAGATLFRTDASVRLA